MRRFLFRLVAQLLLLQLFLNGQTKGANVAVGNPNSFRRRLAWAQDAPPHSVPLAMGQPSLQVLEETANHTRGWLDCRSLSPPRNETAVPVFVKGKSFLNLSKTLTSVVSQLVPGLPNLNNVLHAVKVLASFFEVKNITTVHADYWKYLKNEVEFIVESKMDDSILTATDNAISRMNVDLEAYLNNSQPTRVWSTYLLTRDMDITLNDILSDYYGVSRKERVFLHYLDMATARIVLWQTTALRYIREMGLFGQGSMNSVCDIVLRWRNVYESEMKRVEEDLRPAMDTWKYNWKKRMQLFCREDCDDYWGWGWNKYIKCYVRDGYNGKNYPAKNYQCTHNSCWSNVCNQFCSEMVSERQADVDATFRRMMTVPDTFKKNMEQVESSEMYDYVRSCLAGPGNSGHKVSSNLGALLLSLLVVLALDLRLPLLQ